MKNLQDILTESANISTKFLYVVTVNDMDDVWVFESNKTLKQVTENDENGNYPSDYFWKRLMTYKPISDHYDDDEKFDFHVYQITKQDLNEIINIDTF